jgi:Flp pilus assembly pilin Flp
MAEGDAVTDLFRQYCKDESGATAIEYGLCCMIMLGALISIVGTGGAVDALFQRLTALVVAMS